jgi:hypothetical protein
MRRPSDDTRIFCTRWFVRLDHGETRRSYLCKGVAIYTTVHIYASLTLSISRSKLLGHRLLTPFTLMIFFGPPVELPTDGLSSHNAHFTPGRTSAKVSMIFLQAATVVAVGVLLSEVYLTGICESGCVWSIGRHTLWKTSLTVMVVPCDPVIGRFDRPVNKVRPFFDVSRADWSETVAYLQDLCMGVSRSSGFRGNFQQAHRRNRSQSFCELVPFYDYIPSPLNPYVPVGPR